MKVQTDEQKVKVIKIRGMRQKFGDIPEDIKVEHRKYKDTYERAREPLLQGLASDFDLKLFREAQAKACEVLVVIHFISYVKRSYLLVRLTRYNYLFEFQYKGFGDYGLNMLNVLFYPNMQPSLHFKRKHIAS